MFAAVAVAEVGECVSYSIGENGTQTPSNTTWRGKGKERIDVENPNPGQRDGQIHYHEPNNSKHMYDIANRTFSNSTGRIEELLRTKSFINGLKKAFKYLGLKY